MREPAGKWLDLVRRGATGQASRGVALDPPPGLWAVIRTFRGPFVTDGGPIDSAWAVASVTDRMWTTATVARSPIPTCSDELAAARLAARAGLDCFAHLYELASSTGRSLAVHAHDPLLLSLLHGASASFPGCEVSGAFARSSVRAALSRSAALAEDQVLARQAALAERHERQRGPLIVCTDASLRRGRPGAGIAVMDAEGRHVTKYLPAVSDVFLAELAAIQLAIASCQGRRPLRILSDSKPAVSAINNPSTAPERARSLVDRINAKRQGRQIEIQWIKGHAGHELNETADRLALATRRHRSAGLTGPGHEIIIGNIVSEWHQSSMGLAR
ncbi:ribonuclease H family protein [Lolliginicoccus suaedae]|uniref:ribonuclease H family protein n=1 Tax=Lolliginicoccus suaedae TaxID=2605429 RepID=UPI0011ED502F|nr:ribonuclease H family protein [Lolliginicoccus suaedae]